MVPVRERSCNHDASVGAAPDATTGRRLLAGPRQIRRRRVAAVAGDRRSDCGVDDREVRLQARAAVLRADRGAGRAQHIAGRARPERRPALAGSVPRDHRGRDHARNSGRRLRVDGGGHFRCDRARARARRDAARGRAGGGERDPHGRRGRRRSGSRAAERCLDRHRSGARVQPAPFLTGALGLAAPRGGCCARAHGRRAGADRPRARAG